MFSLQHHVTKHLEEVGVMALAWKASLIAEDIEFKASLDDPVSNK